MKHALKKHAWKLFLMPGLVACGLLPRGVSAANPDPRQKALADQFAAMAVASEFVWNERGQLTHLAISNHAGTPRGKAGNAGAPGVSPDLFRQIVAFPELEGVAIEMQPLADADYQILGELPKLRDVRLQYINKLGKGIGRTPRFINDLPLELDVLELKHNFGIDDGNMEELKPQPGLRKLEIDTGWATSEAVEFIVKSPRIENLQLHRTAMTDQDLRTILAALPELRILEIRPHGQNRNKGTRITGASLQGLAHARKLECLAMSLEWGEMPYEGGLETLVGLEHLRQIDISPGDIKGFSIDDPAIRRLHEARPDIRIQVKNKSVGGGTDFKRIEKDGDEWNWDHGVNTHG